MEAIRAKERKKIKCTRSMCVCVAVMHHLFLPSAAVGDKHTQ